MMKNTTTYLVTGGARGLGRGFVETYLLRPNSTVIAAVRDPGSATAKALTSLATGPGSRLIVIKIDSSSLPSAAAGIAELTSKHGITQLDVVISNAAICVPDSVEDVELEAIQEHLTVNSLAVLVLFQAVFPLMRNAVGKGDNASEHKAPKFVLMSSALGSVTGMELREAYTTYYSYGASKAMAQFTVRRIHFNHPELVAFGVDPGWVQTDMGNAGAKRAGLEKATEEVHECVEGMVKQIDAATRENGSGKNLTWDGQEFPW